MEELVKIQTLRQKYASVKKVLHERGRRIWASDTSNWHLFRKGLRELHTENPHDDG